MTDRVWDPNADPLVGATIDIASESRMTRAMDLLTIFAEASLRHRVRVAGGDCGRAFWHVGHLLDIKGVRNELAA